ncbi:MAG: LysM peptidoglycan-binding domain-containing protein [Chloroflexota bacterium]
MKSLRIAIAVAVSALMLAWAQTPVEAAPLAQENLVANAGFEAGTWLKDGKDELQAPDNWDLFWDSSLDRPMGFNPSNQEQARSGFKAASYWTQGKLYNAGLLQWIRVTPGATYRFTIYGKSWSTTNRDVRTSDTNVQLYVGIDPTGNQTWNAGTVQWSGAVSAWDNYQQLSIEATAQGDFMTVFVRSQPDWAVEQSDTYWDDASLVQISEAAPQAEATQPPAQQQQQPSSGVPAGSIPRSTPNADGTVVHIVSPGETLIGIAVTYEVSLEQIRQLNNLSSDVIYVGQRLVIAQNAGAAAPEEQATEEPTSEDTGDGEGDSGGEVAEEAPPAEEEPALPESSSDSTGTICVRSYDDANESGFREPDEATLAGFTFAVSNGSETVGTHVTDESGTSYCFTDLPAGTYIVSWVADNYVATTDQTWAVSVAPGAAVSREFGARLAEGAEAADEESGSGGGLPTWVTALIAAFGVILLLGGLGVVGYFVIIRPRQQI